MKLSWRAILITLSRLRGLMVIAVWQSILNAVPFFRALSESHSRRFPALCTRIIPPISNIAACTSSVHYVSAISISRDFSIFDVYCTYGVVKRAKPYTGQNKTVSR